MTQTKIHELSNQLAAALGMSERAVAYAAEDLARADMIGQPDEPATVEDAARLLIAIIGDFDVRAPHQVVEMFWNLPLATVQVLDEAPGLHTRYTLPNDNEFVTSVRQMFGDTFKTAITGIIGDFVFLSKSEPPGTIQLSTALGRSAATLRKEDSGHTAMMCFETPDFISGIPTFGLPLANPLRTVEIPAAIFLVLRDALDGSPHSWANAAEDRADAYLQR